MTHDPFCAVRDFQLASGTQSRFYALAALEAAGLGRVSRLPVPIPRRYMAALVLQFKSYAYR